MLPCTKSWWNHRL